MEVLPMDSLPLGFRFRPTDEELVSHYLRHKINGRDSLVQVIPEVDVCKWEPWDLPELSVIKTGDPEWFFFCPRDRKYTNGHRSNRATEAGYWKATGKDRTIKSRTLSPTGNSITNVIGIKKTLVFYKGRAPKGERTYWIMHEYRATEPDLDGNGPGQAAFVLCRLFRKPDEQPGSSKYDEVERTGSSPTPTKSSPDDTYSDRLQEPAIPNTRTGIQSEGIKRWLTDKSDNITPNSLVPVGSCVTEVEDHSAEDTAAEVYPPQDGNLMSDGLAYCQYDHKVIPPWQPHCWPSEFSIDSPYADDFGKDPNGFHFQDGTEEQDLSLTEVFEVFRNLDNYSCKDLEDQMHPASGSENLMNDTWADRGEASNSALVRREFCTELDNDLITGQVHPFPGSAQASCSFHYPKPRAGDLDAFPDSSAGKDASSANFVMGSFHDQEGSNASESSNDFAGTGIKIRAREPQNRRSSQNPTTQGTAPRRIRLQMGRVPEPVCSGEPRNLNSFGDEVGSFTTDVQEGSELSVANDEPEVTSTQETSFECGKRPIWSKMAGNIDSTKMKSSNLMPLSSLCGLPFSKLYALCIYFIVIMSIIFAGLYRCPASWELHS